VDDSVCGDGIPEFAEPCDDGNDVESDGCNSDCTLSTSELWSTTFNTPATEDDAAYGVTVSAAGDIYVVGSRSTAAEGRNVLLLKYDGAGNFQWEFEYNGADDGHDEGFDVAFDENTGHLYVAGASNNPAPAADDTLLLKILESDQSVVWAETQDGSNLVADDSAYGVDLDDAGDIFVAGMVQQTDTNKDIWVRKYEPDGGVSWTQIVAGENNLNDIGFDVAVDNANNVVVAGRIYVDGNGQDMWIRKFSNNLGAELWTRTFNGSDDSHDEARSVAVDADDNVFVAGIEDAAGAGLDGWLRKYNEFGSAQWTQSWTGVGTDDEHGHGVAVDASGNPFVIGSEDHGGLDIWTRSYDADGVFQWKHSQDGADGLADEGWGITVDANGKLVVVGYVTTAGTGTDAWIGKYEPAFVP
jgi:cysteine-rich repeat protein